MISKRMHVKLDLAHVCLWTSYFAMVLFFSYGGLYEQQEHLWILSILMLGMLASYYTSLATAIFFGLGFDFAYATYKIYNNIVGGLSISTTSYIWMVAFPVLVLLSGYSGSLIQAIQNDNKRLQKMTTELATVDAITGLKNANVFVQDMAIYMTLSKRYALNTSLMILEFKHHAELVKVIGKKSFEQLVVEVAGLLSGTTRYEDNKYVLNDYQKFAVIFISNDEGSIVLRDRIRESMAKWAREDTLFKRYQVDFRIGIAQVRLDHETPYEVIEAAEKDMQYDL